MSGEKRLKIALELNDLINKMMKDGIKSQYPGISDKELKEQIALRTKK